MKNIHDFYKMKKIKEKITMVTCYDYSSAKILETAGVDCILVGDTVSMVVHGYPDTTHATIEMISTHVKSVARGAKNTFIIGDLPFLSYRGSIDQTLGAVKTLIQSGAHCVKLEGAAGNCELVQHIVQSGVPVMGHIGLTPQHVMQLGGYKVQGRDPDVANQLRQDAKALEKAGCFAIVLECMPNDLAAEISRSLAVPTIGIGAGKSTDGQVLVYHDLLGLQNDLHPKFVKQYVNGFSLFQHAISQYISEVKSESFPSKEYSYEGR